MTGYPGTLNGRSRLGSRTRRMMTPIDTVMKATNVPIDTASSSQSSGMNPARIPVATATMIGVVDRSHAARVDLCEHRRQQAVAAHREQDAGLAVHHDQGHREDRDHRARGQERAGPGSAGDVLQDHRQPGFGLFLRPELGGVLRAESGEGDQDVEAGDDDQCGDDRAGHGLLRILHLVTGCRYRVEADEREEDHARGRGDAGEALVPEAGEVVGVERSERDDDEHRQHAELDQHHDRC